MKTYNNAGWAERVITPPLGLIMGGRGLRKSPGLSVLDNIYVQAAALSDSDGNILLIISLDLVGLSRERSQALRYAVAEQCGIGVEWVILNFAHIHSGPLSTAEIYSVPMPQSDALKEYIVWRDRTVVSCAYEAVERCSPATMKIHYGSTDIGINRRRRNSSGEMMMAPDPAGTYNRDLWVLDIRKTGNKDRCILFSCGCHPVLVYGYAWNSISADYPGRTRSLLSQSFDEDTHCQFLQALAGNVRPRAVADLEKGTFRKSLPEDVENTARELSGDIHAALKEAGEELDLSLAAAHRVIPAPKDPATIPGEDFWQAWIKGDHVPNRISRKVWYEKIRKGERLNKIIPWPIGLIRLDQFHHLALLGGEPVAEWKNHVQSSLSLAGLHVLGYCQETEGYLPVDEILNQGGYEEARSIMWHRHGPARFAEGLNETVKNGFVILKKEIYG
ncbi:MAG: hypothetical protein ACLFST_13555 [Spirochaetia bacterium]